MPRARESQTYLTPNEVADLLKVSPITVRSWASNGKLDFTMTPGGHRRFNYGDVERFASQHGIRLPGSEVRATRVLIVDDDIALAGYFRELFSTLGEEVETRVVHSGFAAGTEVIQFEPDIVLLDLMMPGMDGFEVCRAIKTNPETRDIKVYAVTGDPSPENVARILSAGAECCLSKPVSSRHLLEVLGLL